MKKVIIVFCILALAFAKNSEESDESEENEIEGEDPMMAPSSKARGGKVRMGKKHKMDPCRFNR